MGIRMVQLRAVQTGETKKLSKTNPKAKRKKKETKNRGERALFSTSISAIDFVFQKPRTTSYLHTHARTQTKQTPAPPSFSSSSPPPSQVHVYATSALPALSFSRVSTEEEEEANEEVSVVTGTSEEGGGGAAGGAGGGRGEPGG